MKKIPLTQEELKKLLHYDPVTGIFTRAVDSKSAKKGDIAGNENINGYVYIKLHCISYLAHRLAWLYVTGEWPPIDLDHRDLNTYNNSWKNLRIATKSQNNHNRTITKRNSTGQKGIWFNAKRGKWEAKITIQKRRINLGRFSSREDAAHAYQRHAASSLGEFYREEAND